MVRGPMVAAVVTVRATATAMVAAVAAMATVPPVRGIIALWVVALVHAAGVACVISATLGVLL
jgi:hypothetical protein